MHTFRAACAISCSSVHVGPSVDADVTVVTFAFSLVDGFEAGVLDDDVCSVTAALASALRCLCAALRAAASSCGESKRN